MRSLTVLLAVAGLAVAPAAAQAPPGHAMYLGPSFDGMAFAGSDEQPGGVVYAFYGDCTPAPSAPSCPVPLQVQSASVCVSNPLETDSPRRRVPVRTIAGVPVLGDGVGGFVALTGPAEITVMADKLTSAGVAKAVKALRPLGRKAPLARLERARLPRWALRELALVMARRRQTPALRPLAKRLGITRLEVRMRIDLARALGPKAIEGVPPARYSPAETKRDRHALLGKREGGLPEGTGESTARLERRAARHAERQRRC